MEQLAVLPSDAYLSPDEIYDDIYVDINTNLKLDINIYNSLLCENQTSNL